MGLWSREQAACSLAWDPVLSYKYRAVVQRASCLFFGMGPCILNMVQRACALFFGIVSVVMFMFIFSAELLLEYFMYQCIFSSFTNRAAFMLGNDLVSIYGFLFGLCHCIINIGLWSRE